MNTGRNSTLMAYTFLGRGVRVVRDPKGTIYVSLDDAKGVCGELSSLKPPDDKRGTHTVNWQARGRGRNIGVVDAVWLYLSAMRTDSPNHRALVFGVWLRNTVVPNERAKHKAEVNRWRHGQ